MEFVAMRDSLQTWEDHVDIWAPDQVDELSYLELPDIEPLVQRSYERPCFSQYQKMASELKVSVMRATIEPRIINILKERTLEDRIKYLVCPPATFQGLCRADQLTRETLLETHSFKFHNFMIKGCPILINKETDILCFENPEALLKFVNTRNSCKVLRDENFASIAVYYNAYKDSHYSLVNNYQRDGLLCDALMSAIRSFGSLRKLYLLQEGYPAEGEGKAQLNMSNLTSYTRTYLASEKLEWDKMWYDVERMNNLPIGQSYRWRLPEVVVIAEGEFVRQFRAGEIEI
ncbi:hypothetical protein ONS95_007140 [Cadophora gregata]|uniref:uncharacterized protein n=1 Tax=Cadophora gregata TaxID=51156 RepID=UPI0026DDB5F8|nr:uncharacterized protein ONS95_007140 [Cadophora gregata]KAK0100688.1 hypothetical protein ONS95_007140 [Cadophora gregata]KAK0117315.1 hypothetical protein ONS96_013147 [Cadophora gregata f. sp. sojae]